MVFTSINSTNNLITIIETLLNRQFYTATCSMERWIKYTCFLIKQHKFIDYSNHIYKLLYISLKFHIVQFSHIHENVTNMCTFIIVFYIFMTHIFHFFVNIYSNAHTYTCRLTPCVLFSTLMTSFLRILIELFGEKLLYLSCVFFT